jgi:hypothetical protein
VRAVQLAAGVAARLAAQRPTGILVAALDIGVLRPVLARGALGMHHSFERPQDRHAVEANDPATSPNGQGGQYTI